ncbi:hypothetical protein ACJIZ3_020423 [Penstemon smallii]|uniref:Uncharacterized protein n=1 Tax=Penstemon smallii TaxID=265156 RepID=A0ABD3SIJ5_9LAMI
MSTQAVRISDIDNTTTSWSIKVIVFDKTQPRHSTSSPRRYQRITFMDSYEQKVVATIYGSDITLFKDTFKIYETYTISNAKVTPLPERYNKYGYPFQWTINRKTAYRAETKETISRSVLKLQFSSLSNLKNLIGQDSLIGN